MTGQWMPSFPTAHFWYRLLALVAVAFLFQREISMGILRLDTVTDTLARTSDLPTLQTNATVETITTFDPETSFHIPAHERLQKLIHEDSIISWGYKKASGFPQELRIKYLLTPELSIARLHELSEEKKLAIWSNISSYHQIVWEPRICDAIGHFRQSNTVKPHVLFTRCNENFGEFSRYVPDGKTINWDLKVNWTENGCRRDDEVWEYLNHSHTHAVFTTQHHFMDHPKVHSLPLGIKHTMKAQVLKLLHESSRVKKTKLLMVNDNGWKHRKDITAAVIENFAKFNMTLINTYNNKHPSHYLKELRRSKFILAPSGLGWDCYRIWEALHFNTIPVIERYHRPHDGWRRTLDGLPVLWVEKISDVTPAMLRAEYRNIATKGSHYQYEKLTRQWWIQFIRSKLLYS